MKVLVIDDCESDLELIRIYLSREGFSELFFAGSAEEGIRMALEHRPEIVLTDTNLPCKTGYDICKELKQVEDYAPWVILMTGAVDGKNDEAMSEAGLDDYCEKTFEIESILHALRRAPSP